MAKVDRLESQISDLKATLDRYDTKLGRTQDRVEALEEEVAFARKVMGGMVGIEADLWLADVQGNDELRDEVLERLEYLRDEVVLHANDDR